MQKTKGISLIVLVITIIVMIILAGAIILTLNNSGMIDKASDAVQKSDEATIKEIAQMAWGAAYAEYGADQEMLEQGVKTALTANNLNTEDYGMVVTTSGVEIAKGWLQYGSIVTKGSQTLEIGDTVNYVATGTDYEGIWKVLGASEYGELLIMSHSDVTTHRLGYKSTTIDSAQKLKESQQAWLNGAADLDEICEAYGKGTGATGARSVKVEDIDRVTGYDPETEKHGEGELYEYGNVVIYSYNGTTKPAYSGSNKKTGALSTTHSNGFHFYNGTEFVHVNDLTTGTSGKTFVTLKSDYYRYGAGDLELTDEASALIFGEYDADMDEYSNYYWLASPYVYAGSGCAYFGMRSVEVGGVYGYSLWGSYGDAYCYGYGVRAVVSLAAGVKISENTSGGWNINI